jgi:hypothetical protein
MVGPPIPSNGCKVFKRKDLRPDFPVQVYGLKKKIRLTPDLSSYHCFKNSRLELTKLQMEVIAW